MLKKKKIIGTIILTMFIIFLIVTILGIVHIKKIIKTLPNVSQVVENYVPNTPTIIYDDKDKIIDKLFTQNRNLVDINTLPPYVYNSFVAIEDRDFYTHHGFDISRIIASVFIDLLKGHFAQGASTITQQLARNAFLNMKKTLERKIKEAIFAIELERKYTKKEILNQYINVIYFGGGVYGINAAAKLYFEKNAKELTIAQAAFLAGIPNNPSLYSPYSKFKNTIKRQKIILKKMLKYHFINENQYANALAEKIELKKNVGIKDIAPEFIDMIYRRVLKKFSSKDILSKGLKVYTSLDLDMQKAANNALKNNSFIRKIKKLNGALVTIDSSNGYVKALVGGKDFKNGDFDRAIMTRRQPGSAFKPFLYLSALRLNYQMNLALEDSEITIGKWTPSDYDDSSNFNMTLYDALRRSINLVAIKLLLKIGYDELIDTTSKVGFEKKIPKFPSVALGVVDVSPFQIAKYYIPFSNGGYKIKPIFIRKIEDMYGNILYNAKIEKTKIFKSKYISELDYMLMQVVKSGTGKNSNLNIQQAGKTGTTNEQRSAWFVGFTPDFVTSIYLGFDDNKPMGKYMTGGGIAAPIWKTYVKQLLDEKIYTPSTFKFIKNDLETKQVVYRSIDRTNGLLYVENPNLNNMDLSGSNLSGANLSGFTIKNKSQNLSKVKMMFLNGYYPIEKSDKYKNGLQPLLDEYNQNKELIYNA